MKNFISLVQGFFWMKTIDWSIVIVGLLNLWTSYLTALFSQNNLFRLAGPFPIKLFREERTEGD